MRLKNKKTGEIKPAEAREDGIYLYDETTEQWYKYELDLLAKWWEYYEEPKGKALYWMILTLENFIENEPDDKWVDLEDCKQMLEKLKAWERLKDKCFRFYRWNKGSLLKSLPNTIEFACDDTRMWSWEDIQDDLDLLFGGEE